MHFPKWLMAVLVCSVATLAGATNASANMTATMDVGGGIIGEPDVIVQNPGSAGMRIRVFARGLDNALWTRMWTKATNDWGNWTKVGGYLTSSPSCTYRQNQIIDCFVRTSNNVVSHIAYIENSGWTGWDSLGGKIKGAPEAVTNGDNYILLTARGWNNALMARYFDDGWSAQWFDMGGIITSDPACAYVRPNVPTAIGSNLSAGHARCVAAGSGGSLWIWNTDKPTSVWQTAQPSGWKAFGGDTADKAAMVRYSDTYLGVFRRDAGGTIYHTAFDEIGLNYKIEPWKAFGQHLTSGPSCISVEAPDAAYPEVRCYYRSETGSVEQLRWVPDKP